MKKSTKIKGEEWSWDEDSETRAAVERLHRDIKERVKEAQDDGNNPTG